MRKKGNKIHNVNFITNKQKKLFSQGMGGTKGERGCVCVYKKCENNYSKAVLSWTKESDTSKQINNKKRYIYIMIS